MDVYNFYMALESELSASRLSSKHCTSLMRFVTSPLSINLTCTVRYFKERNQNKIAHFGDYVGFSMNPIE